MEDPTKTEDNRARFRGSWAPLIKDPIKYSYATTAGLSSSVMALEKAAEQHDHDGIEEKSEEPPVRTLTTVNGQSHEDALVAQDPSRAPYARDPMLLDAEMAMQRVQKLKAKHPEMDLDALCEILIQTKCKQGALVGVCSAGPAMLLPGWGSLASVLLGSVADLTLTTKLEVDLALEIACLYGLWDVYCMDSTARRAFLLHVAGLEGLDAEPKEEDEKATREAGERLATRATEEVGKASLLKFVPILGATVGAGTNVVGIFVVGRRTQLICKGESVGTWRESINKHIVPYEISRSMAIQLSRVPSALTLRVAQVTTSLGSSARRLVAMGSSSSTTSEATVVYVSKAHPN